MFRHTSLDVAWTPHAVLLRDVKDHGHGPHLRIDPPDWHDFLSGVAVESLTISEHDRVTGHDGTWVHTRWHLRDRTGTMLHFTDREWTAFWAGATDEELALLSLLEV
ncbi:MAG TPA: DUF397 domain-containing protein [Pseudonocardia sp.]|jgi:hypothetical protein|uniref:DUF397 domain-containing protein n=1 Tax=Pseudonocardia sp. TaxID=60912 RepID=UPI002F418960